ncbi:DUF4301 family protein [Hoylesella enoeca]|nr:DUF4301 family protein [Hoylesella enoeca]
MLTEKDLKQIADRGISAAQVEHQIEQIKAGFPFLKLESAAAVGHGIVAPNADDCEKYINVWNRYKSGAHRIVKFVPASGAASRMFKDLFAFLHADYDVPTTDFEKQFFEHIREFAFRKELCSQCKRNVKKSVCTLLEEGNYKEIVAELLEAKGLDYGNLPKGLLLFHNYEDGPRTPMEEHLVEAALYAASGGEANVHFTVSHDHLALFEQKVAEKEEMYSKRFGVRYHISFSEQKPSTDTIAVNLDNTPFRDEDGSLVFRPAGHGALIENLNEIDADIIFIKNIDNVVPDRLKDETVRYKQVIAGLLVDCQKQVFAYLDQLENGSYTRQQLEEILYFTEQTLCCCKADAHEWDDEQLAVYLQKKLNRPMRVCGVVKNVGEPGGGPFLTYNQDGTVSPQILESSQIDKDNSTYVKMFTEGTHFNPVDLVCAIRDHHGKPFHLPDYVDPKTGFISRKSKNGRDLKALELPGLWNGAMSDWNTIFVEVPLSTFNPVKTVNDLLREQHQ